MFKLGIQRFRANFGWYRRTVKTLELYLGEIYSYFFVFFEHFILMYQDTNTYLYAVISFFYNSHVKETGCHRLCVAQYLANR